MPYLVAVPMLRKLSYLSPYLYQTTKMAEQARFTIKETAPKRVNEGPVELQEPVIHFIEHWI